MRNKPAALAGEEVMLCEQSPCNLHPAIFLPPAIIYARTLPRDFANLAKFPSSMCRFIGFIQWTRESKAYVRCAPRPRGRD